MNRPPRRPPPAAVLLPLVALLLGGCFTLSRNAPPLRQYVLSGDTPVPANGRLAVGLRRAEVASYLDGRAIVVRRGRNEVVPSKFHRWSEPLDEAVNRVVGSHLAGMRPVGAVEVAPWAARARHDVWVQLHLLRFEGVTDGTAVPRTLVEADWDIVNPGTGRVLIRGRSTVRDGTWRTDDYGTLVTALDAGLARVARDIATCLAGFRNDTTPPTRCGTMASADTR